MSIEDSNERSESTRVEFEAGKYIELTETEPGRFVVTGENFREEHQDLFLRDTMDLPAESVVQDEGSDLHSIFGWTSHLRIGAVEIDFSDYDDMWIKAPSLEDAIAALKLAKPHGEDPRDR